MLFAITQFAADTDDKQQGNDGQAADGCQVRRKGKSKGKQAENVAESDKQENGKNQVKIFQSFRSDVFLNQPGDKTVYAIRN